MMANSEQKNACTSFDAELHDLLLGEIEPAQQALLEAHLSSCVSCRVALEEARDGLLALEGLEESPLPFRDVGEAESTSMHSPVYRESAWLDFKSSLGSPAPVAREALGFRLLAAAALLLLGIGLGMQLGNRRAGPITSAKASDERIEPETIASLARIELLTDVGVGYTQGVRDLLDHMSGMDADRATPAELEATREIARDLVRDGRLLRRTLDPARDRVLLAAVNRAELVLEEIAAVGSSGLGAPSSSVDLAVHDDVLRTQLTSVTIDRRPEPQEERPRRSTTTFPRGEGIAP